MKLLTISILLSVTVLLNTNKSGIANSIDNNVRKQKTFCYPVLFLRNATNNVMQITYFLPGGQSGFVTISPLSSYSVSHNPSFSVIGEFWFSVRSGLDGSIKMADFADNVYDCVSVSSDDRWVSINSNSPYGCGWHEIIFADYDQCF